MFSQISSEALAIGENKRGSMKNKAKQPQYKEESRDGLELPVDAKILTRDGKKALGIQPPTATAGHEWERIEEKDKVILKSRRGGKRPGAGRKPKGHVRMQVLVSKSTKEKSDDWLKNEEPQSLRLWQMRLRS